MKKFIIMFLMLLGQIVIAETIPVEAINNFSSEKPPRTMSVKVLQDLYVCADVTFKAGDIVYGKVFDVTDPKRLKRDAGFSFVPMSYHGADGKNIEIKGYYPAKYTTKMDKAGLAKSAALSVGNYFIKGLSIGYSAVEGAVKNEKDNRVKSSLDAVYEKTPLSYVEKGNALLINSGDTFYLNFKTENKENLPNYEYKLLD